jgi:hypothetical protein
MSWSSTSRRAFLAARIVVRHRCSSKLSRRCSGPRARAEGRVIRSRVGSVPRTPNHRDGRGLLIEAGSRHSDRKGEAGARRDDDRRTPRGRVRWVRRPTNFTPSPSGESADHGPVLDPSALASVLAADVLRKTSAAWRARARRRKWGTERRGRRARRRHATHAAGSSETQ